MKTAAAERIPGFVSGESFPKCYEVERILPARKPVYAVCKRSFDIAASLLLGIALLVPMLLIALWIRLDSGGPVLYRQERLGKDGRPFLMYKFRSMVPDAEREGPRWAEFPDRRCTRAGRFLRLNHLDELPQLWNILIGDMSFVGPRPERECFYDRFETDIHGFRHRLAVVPGLTGWAQVNGGYDLLPEEKIVFDMEYIRHRSAWMDLKCIIRTLRLLCTHGGAR